MNKTTNLSKFGFSLRIVSATALLLATTQLATPAWAESAPVFDADAMSQAFDQPTEPAQEYPMPQDSTFVPMQPEPMGPPPQQAADRSNLPMQQRLKKLEQQLANLQNGDSPARIESLQTQVQTLRGQVEHMLRVFEQMQEQQHKSFTEFERRLAELSSALGKPVTTTSLSANTVAPVAPAATGVATAAVTNDANAKAKPLAVKAPPVNAPSQASQPNVAEEQQIYQTAYNLIKNKKYNDAVNVLQSMLQKYPTGQFASNAHYWLGELYGLLGKNEQALAEFDTVVKSYPDSPRVSDAQLKVGLIYAAEFKWPEAKQNLRKVINRYPGTTSARLAQEQLKQIKQAGH